MQLLFQVLIGKLSVKHVKMAAVRKSNTELRSRKGKMGYVHHGQIFRMILLSTP